MTAQIEIPDSHRLVCARFKGSGTAIDIYDDGWGPLWMSVNSISFDGIVRARTWDDAYQIAVDELLNDGDEDIPEDDQSHEYACWSEANTFRSGTPANPKLKSTVAAIDLNGQDVVPLTEELLEDHGIELDIRPWEEETE
jgi:hypothetical protein